MVGLTDAGVHSFGVVGAVHRVCGTVHLLIERAARDQDGLDLGDGCPAGRVAVDVAVVAVVAGVEHDVGALGVRILEQVGRELRARRGGRGGTASSRR